VINPAWRKSMGSLTVAMPQDRKAYLDYVLSGPGIGIITSSMVGNIYYAAFMNFELDLVLAAVVKTESGGGYFTYKLMDESAIPCYFDCPKKILDLLTPVDVIERNNAHFKMSPKSIQNCSAWRDECAKSHDLKAKRRKLKIGVKIKLPAPVLFTGGDKHDTFIKVKGNVFHPVGAGYNVRLQGHHLDGFEIIT
jgi:hypothetical protein